MQYVIIVICKFVKLCPVNLLHKNIKTFHKLCCFIKVTYGRHRTRPTRRTTRPNFLISNFYILVLQTAHCAFCIKQLKIFFSRIDSNQIDRTCALQFPKILTYFRDSDARM